MALSNYPHRFISVNDIKVFKTHLKNKTELCLTN